MENMIAVAQKGFILRDGKALIIRRSENLEVNPGTWECPGGKLEFGENLEEALCREIKEETGLHAQVVKALYTSTFHSHSHRQVVILSYHCLAPTGDVQLSVEHTEYLWAGRSDMESRLHLAILQDMDKHNVWEQLEIK